MSSDPWLIARFERLATLPYWLALIVALLGLAARLSGLPLIGPTAGRRPALGCAPSGERINRQPHALLRQPGDAWSKNVLAATSLASLRLVLFTDGVTDVFPRAAQGDGFQELRAFLHRLGPADAETTADACMSFAARDARDEETTGLSWCWR
ncbi:MAG TPA: hypothetical protein VM470_02610 [Acidimicrobiia bacterium]|nr:hypothetical protein [Acidimicrobiia bacterium]